MIEGAMVLVRMFAASFWGYVADCSRSQKAVAISTRAAATVVLILLAFPTIAKGFTIILAISMGTAAFSSSSILDTYTLDFLGKTHKGRYGEIRLWMAVSWGLGSLAMGFVTDVRGSPPPSFLPFLPFSPPPPV